MNLTETNTALLSTEKMDFVSETLLLKEPIGDKQLECPDPTCGKRFHSCWSL